MKRTISLVLLCAGILFLVVGIYQVVNEDYRFEKKQYISWMSLYEKARLSISQFTYADLKENAESIANSSYRSALNCQDKIEQYRKKAIIFGAIGLVGIIIGSVGIITSKNNSPQTQE